MIKNISFVFQKIWLKHRGLLCYLILCVLSSLGISVVAVWFPAFVVSRISTGKADAAQLAAAGLVAVCVYGLQQMASSGRGMRQLFLCRDFLYEIFLKRFDKACAYAESTEGQKAYGMARQTALWGSDFRIFLEGILDLCVCIGSFVLFGGAIFGLQPGLFFVLLLLSAAGYVVCHKNEKAYQRLLEEQAGENRRFFYFIGAAQNEKYGKDMRLYQLSEVVSGKIDGCLKSLVQMQKKYFFVLARSGMLEGAIACVRDIVVFLYLIQKCAAQEISAAEFVLYYGIAMQFSNFVTVFVHSYSQLQTGSKGIEKIRTYMQEGEAPAGQQKTECTQKVECARAAEEISFQDVSFGYNTGRLVIDGLNLNIRKGEKLALIGENGAGKTTLVKLLCGLYPVSSGKITIQGTEVSRGQADFIRDQVAVLFQDALVLPYTVAENVSLKPLEETDQNQVWAALEQAGLSERIKQEPNGILTQMTKAVSGDGISLSGGEAQKLLMARMLYHKSAQIWILDEPTAALDAIAESEVYEKFRELGKEKTCIYISHRLASTQFMDRIILLKDGKIQESGTHKELMAQNRMYARLYEIQSRYYREEEQQ